MSVNREAIMTALFARLQAIPGVQTCSRKWVDWSQCDAVNQPAIYLTNGNEQAHSKRNMPTTWTLLPTIYVYVRNDADPNASGGVVLNGLLQAIEAAFERTPGETAAANGPFSDSGADSFGTTLGGLVNHCYINGTIETDEGLLQNQCLAIIPVEILTSA